jgi:hypothetical protein
MRSSIAPISPCSPAPPRASGSASGTILFIHVQQLFGPPPPDERSLAFLALTGWLVPPWGFWIDRTRVVDPA